MAQLTDLDRIAVMGDRAIGKSHMLLNYAVAQGIQGKSVLWLTWDLHYARHDLLEAAELSNRINADAVRRVNRANGCYAIEFVAGGRVDFRSVHSNVRGCRYDLQISDAPGLQADILNVVGDRLIQTVGS